jgi:flagellar FliL protein
MMRMLLPVVLLLIGIGGGVGAGFMLGGNAEDVVEAESDPVEDDSPEDDDYAGEEEPTSANAPRVEQTGEGTEFVRLNNQFVVPIVRNGAVRSLVVMSMSVEVTTGQSAQVFNQEPRLRDSFLRAMFAHANVGGFDGRFTEAAAMAPLREALLEAAQGIVGEGITYDVLITDITRQDA